MVVDKVQARQPIWMAVIMMVSGEMIKSMEWANFSTSTRRNTMGNGTMT